MKTLIAEQPLMMAVLLGAIAAAALLGWVQTGKKQALWTGLVVLILIPISWYVSLIWVTDREQIREAIYRTAQAVKDNDFDRALEIIEPSRRELIASARGDLTRFRFTEARINQLRSIEVIEESVPPEAEVDLSAKAVVSDVRGQFTDLPVLRRVVLRFRKAADGNWYVYDYNHFPIVGQADSFSPHP
jgi:hypothetical protein